MSTFFLTTEGKHVQCIAPGIELPSVICSTQEAGVEWRAGGTLQTCPHPLLPPTARPSPEHNATSTTLPMRGPMTLPMRSPMTLPMCSPGPGSECQQAVMSSLARVGLLLAGEHQRN